MITAIFKALWMSLNILVGFVSGLIQGTFEVIGAILGGSTGSAE